ncbi:MAG: cell wall-binding repeat-containing protein [Lachnospiraceae bacterium]|nr:cell wall-binding repeat-containing protein [Lachnospiraceae bacterium]
MIKRKPLIRGRALILCTVMLCTAGVHCPAPTIGAVSVSDGAMKIDLSKEEYAYSDQKITAKVTNRAVNTVREEIFGGNVSWIDDGYGLWDPAAGAPEVNLLAALKNSGITHLRYPGGIEGDYFHWNETVGEMSSRKDQIYCFSSDYPTYDEVNGVAYPVTFGVDELFTVCRDAGIKATIQLNTGNGTPQEAAAYVSYLKQKGYMDDVESICIGNESCMAAETVPGLKVTQTPDEYIAFAQNTLDLIGPRTVNDPDVELGVIGITPSHPLCRYSGWDARILEALAPRIDFIDVHIGYSYYSQKDESAEDCVRCFMASAKWIEDMIREEEQLISVYAGDYADDIGIQISECGPVGGLYPNSLAGAIFTADLYSTILRHPSVTATDYLPALNHYASAQLLGSCTYRGVSGYDVFWDNCVSYVYRWLSSQRGRSVLETVSAGGETFDSAAVGLVPAVSGVSAGMVQTYYDGDSGKGSIFVINRSLDKNQSFDISLPVQSARITGVTELWDADPTAANSYRNTGRVKPSEYGEYNGRFDGKIALTTKPVSLVKIDFQASGSPDGMQWNDSFDTDSTGFYRPFGPDNAAWGTWSAEDGALTVHGNTGAQWWGSGALILGGIYRDFVMEFDADVSAGYGVMLRAQDDALTPGKGLNTWYGGNGVTVMHWVPAEAGANLAVYDYNGSNTQLHSVKDIGRMSRAHWVVTVCGNEYGIEITDRNDPAHVVRFSFTDDRYESGYIGFYNLTYEGMTTLRIDDLAVTPIRPKPDIFDGARIVRSSGRDRYDTAIATAGRLKKLLGIDAFDTVIVASGSGNGSAGKFPDALSGSYLAAAYSAPVLMVGADGTAVDRVSAYIRENLAQGGRVYILGGTGSVPASMEDALHGIETVRLSGRDRYATNLMILAQAGVSDGDDLMIADGGGFADALSASALGRAILLTDKQSGRLTPEQEIFLGSRDFGHIYILGGSGSVPESIESGIRALAAAAEVERISGRNRYDTSVAIAERFFPTADCVALALGTNFPDGLTGGPLAYALGAPLVLTGNDSYMQAADYAAAKEEVKLLVFGGTGTISDETLDAIRGK